MVSTPSEHNKALYVDQESHFSVQDNVSSLETNGQELLIENKYSGINAADIRHATDLGIRPNVIGYDFCGRVLSSPPGSKLEPNDVVAGYTPTGLGRQSKYGTHQSHLVCPEDMAYKVPENLPETHAGSLTVVAMTAADVIFNLFGFPLPSSPGNHQRPILIWGASSSVGICAVQFAKASGCQNIFVTASPGRHELLGSLGATHTFDYASPTVVKDIIAAVEALGHGSIGHALDSVGVQSPSSSALLEQCVSDPSAVLAATIPYPKFKMPVATTKDDWEIHPLGAPGPVRIPARPEDHWNAWKALEWAIDSYGKGFKLPVVRVFDGTAEEALEEVVAVETMKRGSGKVVIHHPMT
ncbi:hypothetical protein FSARC_13766 [Fusarium sarcochroum]|uniref:Enoyl reductase (ER) domain-containing protein n=1 Tax=Fusarium sarcochroum TaxID=1208366 RepID=A0A8H4SZ78_9HYPO|nr:hypothetical protein FSARC_13766 [Fusarium sarcochroum]